MLQIDTTIQGDCLDVLQGLESESINCCITSPPYYGLRDYGVDGQIGLEKTDIKKDPRKVNGAIQAMLSNGLIISVERKFDGHSKYFMYEATDKLSLFKNKYGNSRGEGK